MEPGTELLIVSCLHDCGVSRSLAEGAFQKERSWASQARRPPQPQSLVSRSIRSDARLAKKAIATGELGC